MHADQVTRLNQEYKAAEIARWKVQRMHSLKTAYTLIHEARKISKALVYWGVDPMSLLRRQRWREFTTRTVKHMADGQDLKLAARNAAREAFFACQNWSDAKVDKKVAMLFKKPDVCTVIEALFDKAGMSVDQATQLHADLMRAGNYAAIRDYWSMTMPKQPTKIEMDQTTTHVHKILLDERKPETLARPVVDMLPPAAEEEHGEPSVLDVRPEPGPEPLDDGRAQGDPDRAEASSPDAPGHDQDGWGPDEPGSRRESTRVVLQRKGEY